ncbi:HEPN/Toprim-associated domain-containing protein [Chitinophaga sedimenti]|uniref:HEPN/Toprim-associated domain-containing protein n=1 Tax=Chitinophaga sedimenti TaxID=2033606 RepID=UPI0020036F0E|nr:HEPN/Toprim-associated domain-containing protein [Chitinophaga sedimenti]MCK7559402.1 HEPN/Toprim-associated domain-containing protein [Chitinophaga sedimenti]
MGSYCSIKIAGYEFDSSKSYINPFYALIFSESNRRIRRVHFSEYYTSPIEDGELVDCIEYAATASIVKERLELLGFKLERAILEYEYLLKDKLSSFENISFELGQVKIKELINQGFKAWLAITASIIENEVKYRNLDNTRNRAHDDLATFIIDQGVIGEWVLSYPSAELGLGLRAILEAVEESSELVLDVTSLIYSGHYEKNEPICLNTAMGEARRSQSFQKTLILTEGTTDLNFLSRSFALLRPHLSEYFSFLDITASKPDAGTSGLERTIKTLAASGIANNIVAVFDNDSAGQNSVLALQKLSLPTNINVTILPDLDFARTYPTIGPNGTTDGDINGRACSIELYLGTNILKDDFGAFIPVRWGGFVKGSQSYQGEIEQKSLIQDRFRTILSVAEKGGSTLEHDWTGMCLILDHIISIVSSNNSVQFNGVSEMDDQA